MAPKGKDETLAVPKVELHCHIEGAAPPRLVRQLADQQGVDVSEVIDGKGQYVWCDFTSFLKAYDTASSVFKTPADYALLAETYFRMLAAEGAIYGEIFISPDHAQAAGLSYRSYVEGPCVRDRTGKNRYGHRRPDDCNRCTAFRHSLRRTCRQGSDWQSASPGHPDLAWQGMNALDIRQTLPRRSAWQPMPGWVQQPMPGNLAGRKASPQPWSSCGSKRLGHGVAGH